MHRDLCNDSVPSKICRPEAVCDCGHDDGVHAVPGTWPGGRGWERWCAECSCVRFNDAANPDPEL